MNSYLLCRHFILFNYRWSSLMCHTKLVHHSRGRNTVKYSKQVWYSATEVCVLKENSTDFTHQSPFTGNGEYTAYVKKAVKSLLWHQMELLRVCLVWCNLRQHWLRLKTKSLEKIWRCEVKTKWDYTTIVARSLSLLEARGHVTRYLHTTAETPFEPPVVMLHCG